jgi:hypothetical protein
MIKGDRRQEALSYADVEPHFVAAKELGRISGTVPVHFIWGSGSPLVYVRVSRVSHKSHPCNQPEVRSRRPRRRV